MYKFRTQGFTLIELMICVVIVGIILAVVVPAIFGHHPTPVGDGSVCQAGYKYVQQYDGTLHQVIGANGGGVPCNP